MHLFVRGMDPQLRYQQWVNKICAKGRSAAAERKEKGMDNVTVIRVIAGVCFFVVLFILIQRRRRKIT